MKQYSALAKLLVVVFSTLQINFSFAQNCGADVINKKLLRENPGYASEQHKLQMEITNRIVAQSSQRRGLIVYTIPVVVHVIHLGETEGTGSNISAAQIQLTLDGLNDRFRNIIGTGVDAGIEFCLAAQDPNGNPTSGINRVDGSAVTNYILEGIQWDETGGADEIEVKSLSIWPRDEYYNIWVVHNIYGSVAGYAYYPTTYIYEGTVIEDNFMTSGSTVLTHEMGHAFFLPHTFEDDDDGTICPIDTACSINGDLICDTPPHKRGDCGSSNPCTASGVWDNSRFNYMSYCNSTTRFTSDQQVRMEAAVNSFARISLLSSPGCIASTCAQVCSDNDPCTLNLCDNGSCVFQPMNCDDGSACTFDSCGQFECFNIFVGCDDDNPCTVDFCNGTQCINDTMDCNDGNPCTIDYCMEGDCVNDIVLCDDSDPCTDDLCGPQTTSITIDYDAIDENITQLLGGSYSRNYWTLNSNFQEISQNNFNLQWVAVRFNWLDDYFTFEHFEYIENEVIVDSVDVLFVHQNLTGTPDTIIITVYEDEGNQGVIYDVLNNDNITNNVLYADTFITTVSLTASLSSPEIFRIFPELILQQEQQFVVGVHFYGSTSNTFRILSGAGNLCNENCLASPSSYDVNSFWKLIYVSGGNISGVNNLFFDCNSNGVRNPENCELLDLQNHLITAYVTLKSKQQYECTHLPVPCTNIISGTIQTEDGNPVAGAIVKLTGSEEEVDTTDIDGFYSFDVQQGADVLVAPTHDEFILGCVSTIDLIKIQRQVLTIDTLGAPFKIIAADVNASGTVTAIDIGVARNVILGNTTVFTNGRLWRFVQSNFDFGDTLHPFPFDTARTYLNQITDTFNQNFTAIRLGDVDGTCDQPAPRMSLAGEIKLVMDEYSVLPGDEILVPVKVKYFTSVAGYQFTLSWDAEVIEFLEVNDASLNGFFGTQKTSEGFLTTSWNDATGEAKSLDDESVLFVLKFKAAGTTGTFSLIKIGSELTQSEAYNDNLDLLSITATNGVVNVEPATEIVNHQSGIYNLRVQPNPFNHSAHIIFSLAKSEKVTISIYDLLGKEVKRMEANYQSGEHKIEWEGDDNNGIPLSAGLYHIRLNAGNETRGVKVAVR